MEMKYKLQLITQKHHGTGVSSCKVLQCASARAIVQLPKTTWRLGAPAALSSRSSRENTWNWLVVDLHLWKIWVRQLGWWNSQYMEKSQMCQTTNQEMNWTDTSPGHSKSVFAPATQSESSTISGLGKNNCQSLNSCMKGTYFRK